MLEYIYNYFFPQSKQEQKIQNCDLLILNKSININDMNKLDNNSYRIN